MLREFRTLLPYLRRYWPRYLAGLLFLLLADAGQLYLPQLVRRAVDLVASGGFSLAGLVPPVLLAIATAGLIALGRFFWRFFINGSSRRIENELRERLFAHLQALSTTFYGKSKTGDLMAHMTNDMNAIRMATGMAFVSFVDGFFLTLAILVILLAQNPRLALLSISPLPVLTVGVILFGKIVGEKFKSVQEGFSAMSDLAQESIAGIRVLKIFVQEQAFGRRFADKNRDYSDRNLSLAKTFGFFFPLVGFLAGLTSLIFLLLGGRSVMEGSLSPGMFTAFFAYLQMLIWPMLGAGFTVNLLQRAGASLGRINKILAEQPDIASPPPAQARRGPLQGDIRLHALSYAYPGMEKPVLLNLELDIPAGSIVGLLGRTGSGKSTLVNLLPRLLDPPPGAVFVDGHDVREYDLASLRSAIRVVPQDTFLFSTSIRENIAFGAEDADAGLLEKAAAISTIRRDLGNFPQGWETVVGERGITLSGGQKQRVALSRAIAAQAAIYILDDAMSSVDTETEEAILSALLPRLRGSTVILVSHRVSTLRNADRVVVLEGGRITQEGTPAQLAAIPGFYADILRLQQLEKILKGHG
ncbi:MAG: ABC transporter [Spirochaetes bacterium RBG_16_67_19]|nr:MAG: ABC transporter [Spirochaetes bacterium RBG_16_67_19]